MPQPTDNGQCFRLATLGHLLNMYVLTHPVGSCCLLLSLLGLFWWIGLDVSWFFTAAFALVAWNYRDRWLKLRRKLQAIKKIYITNIIELQTRITQTQRETHEDLAAVKLSLPPERFQQLRPSARDGQIKDINFDN